MDSCTFFGHRDTPKDIEQILRPTLLNLIENNGVRLFYVGNHGSFDAMVRRQLSAFEKTHDIRFFVVLAYLPTNNDPFAEDPHTIYPEGMETVPPRFAVGKRNLWMLDRSRFVVTYVRRDTGGAARFRHIAEKKGKTIITL